MSKYMITYYISDTCGCGCSHDGEEHNHEHAQSSEGNIISKIKSLGSWAHFMPEGFLLKSEFTAEEILAEIKSVSNSGDILFVTKITDAESCACVNPDVINWLFN